MGPISVNFNGIRNWFRNMKCLFKERVGDKVRELKCLTGRELERERYLDEAL